jgi:hypothetical protein
MRVTPTLLLTAAALAACSSAPERTFRSPEEAAPALEREVAVEARNGPDEDGEKPRRNSSSRVLAHVNGEVVNYRDILLELGPEVTATIEPEERRELEQQELIRLVRDRVILQDAREYEVPVTRQEFEKSRDQRVKELEQNGGTIDAFLAEQGMSKQEWEQKIKDGIRIEKYMLARIGRSGDPAVRVPPLVDIYVSPGETRDFWDSHPELQRQPAMAKVRMFTLRPIRGSRDPAAADREVRRMAEEVRRRLTKGDDAAALWRELNEGVLEADPGEGLLEIQRGERAGWIEEFAFGNDRGTVSEILQPGGFGTTCYVLRAAGHHEARAVPYEERQDEIRRQLGGLKWQAARYKIELLLLDKSTIDPSRVRRKVRSSLLSSFAKLDQLLQHNGRPAPKPAAPPSGSK